MVNDKEKAKLGAETLEEFLKQFGNDAQAELILNCLFKELIDAETLFIFSQQKQEGNQVNNDIEQ